MQRRNLVGRRVQAASPSRSGSLRGTLASQCEWLAVLRQPRFYVMTSNPDSQVLGYLAFFQAARPFLQPGGKFIFLSSGSATIDQVPRGYEVTYGISKVGPSDQNMAIIDADAQ